MIKMYNAEVLSKFPVVQHFPFGSLFQWEKNPNAPPPLTSTHTTNQPLRTPAPGQTPKVTTMRPANQDAGTKAPWASATASSRSSAMPGPTSSWTGQASAPGMPATRAPWASATGRPPAPPIAGRSIPPFHPAGIARPTPSSIPNPVTEVKILPSTILENNDPQAKEENGE
jgi:serine/threonine-protein phosphatase 2A activator